MGRFAPAGYGPQVVPPSIIRGRMVVRLDGGAVYVTGWRLAARTDRTLSSSSGGGALGERYGRGKRDSVRRRARAVTESPISANSATAWIAVPMTSGRLEAGGTGERGETGMPRGWGGWRRRPLRPLPVVDRLGLADTDPPVARGRLAALEAGAGLDAWAAVATDGAPGSADGGLASTLAGRLVLRRWGRVRGRAPSRSEGRSLAISHQ
jgi:hypothetical protein